MYILLCTDIVTPLNTQSNNNENNQEHVFPWHFTVSNYQRRHYFVNFSHQPWEANQTRRIISTSQVGAQVSAP